MDLVKVSDNTTIISNFTMSSITNGTSSLPAPPPTMPILWPVTANKYIDWILPPLCLVISNVCNILSILTMSRKSMRSTSVGIYLLILAVCDIIYINALFIPEYTDHINDYKTNVSCWLKCKISLTLQLIFSHTASWIIVAVSLDRVVMVARPFQAQIFCTPKRASIVCLVIFVIFLALDAKQLYFANGRFRYPGTTSFIPLFATPEYQKLWDKYWIWVITLLNHITFPILCIINSIIIYFLRKGIRARMAMTGKNEKKNNKDTMLEASNGGQTEQANSKSSQPMPKTRPVRSKSEPASKNELNFTKVLLIVSTSSVVMNLPFASLVIILLGKFWNYAEHTLYENALIGFCYELTYAIATVHRASYFFMYCITGKKFRTELKNMFYSVIGTDASPKYETSKTTNISTISAQSE